jgi:hypothetical protein
VHLITFRKQNLIILFSIMTLNDVFITGYNVALCIGSGLVADLHVLT